MTEPENIAQTVFDNLLLFIHMSYDPQTAKRKITDACKKSWTRRGILIRTGWGKYELSKTTLEILKNPEPYQTTITPMNKSRPQPKPTDSDELWLHQLNFINKIIFNLDALTKLKDDPTHSLKPYGSNLSKQLTKLAIIERRRGGLQGGGFFFLTDEGQFVYNLICAIKGFQGGMGF